MFLYVLVVGLVLLILSIIYGAVYVPSVDWAVEEMIALAQVKKGERVVDLGSGNGKVLIAMARKGAIAHGYEINPLLFIWSLFCIWKQGVWGKAHPHFGSFFHADLSSYAVITIFVVPYIMPAVEQKVVKSAKKGTRIVVETFPFPHLVPIKKEKSVYLYKL